ncbi:hypothetical protein PRIPAC_80196 [Pristionchus pacificus]|uniref:ADP ribosylation factor n=1 Tax=Pristionchus pacificus TaxID=54126 RepID=A0A2A6CQD1_PRIPA|nr:hypothetical protein PRIPAC_80196 [Pristionchus pacificus]|eukprot:PDM80267.1 ADP ribosylation factor [Pristionchus pacificus]
MGITMAKCASISVYDETWGDAPDNDNMNVENNIPVTIRNAKLQAAISVEIDESLEREKNEDLKRLKILLLGGSDAGKSTILKQMRILHMNGFSNDEMHSFHKHLKLNVFQNSINRFAGGISRILGFDDEQENEYLLSFLIFKSVQTFLGLYPNYASLPDNAHYFLPKLTALLSLNYSPSAEDILHLRIPTTSVNEINFVFSKRAIRLIDVGGQRTYRKKWMHYFDGVAAVLFVVSMAAYDQALDDVDKSVKPVMSSDVLSDKDNRLRDSVQQFGDMLRSKYLLTSAFILFLNKKDLFWKKLARHPLEKFISGYKGTTNEEAAAFLKEHFIKRRSKTDKDRPIYSHYTCATDTKNVEFVFKAACEIVWQKNLNNSGIQ